MFKKSIGSNTYQYFVFIRDKSKKKWKLNFNIRGTKEASKIRRPSYSRQVVSELWSRPSHRDSSYGVSSSWIHPRFLRSVSQRDAAESEGIILAKMATIFEITQSRPVSTTKLLLLRGLDWADVSTGVKLIAPVARMHFFSIFPMRRPPNLYLVFDKLF